ncbi:MAG: radical SAM protein [Acutalibacteraceae bacterium]|nr:radical SAM protein [Acutalibacteraceae bacterium]
MYKNLYENRTNYIYEIDKLYGISQEGYSFLLFNPYINYWMPLDDIGVEIFTKISELHNISKVEKYFCDKYGITSELFQSDCSELIESFVKRKFFTIDENSSNKQNWMDTQYNLDNIDKYPFYDMYISLSDKCNLDCIYCFNKEQRISRINDKNTKIITTEKIKEILLEFKSLGGEVVVFTGGEPTLNKDFVVLCEYAKEIGLKIDFITNGLLLNTLDFDRLFKCVDSFGISFDSIVDSELNELWNVSTKNLSSSLLSNLKKVDEWAEKNNKKINIGIMSIVSKLNKDSLRKLVVTLSENITHCVLDWKMTKYDEIGKTDVDRKMSITEQMYIESVFSSLKTSETEKNKHILAYAYNQGNKMAPSHEPKVMSCAPSFFITNNGSIYPCQGCEMSEYYCGNIYDISLKEAFMKDAFKEVRKRIVKNNMEKCKDCELRFVCVAEGRPCISEIASDCKEKCIKRMFVDTFVN